jgi:16S rRNA (guanine527-N7)-methyltransferase
MPEKILRESLEALKISLSENVQKLLLSYLDFVLQSNEKLNLTSIKYPNAVSHHLVDSLSVLQLSGIQELPEPWVDLGSGAGFPGIPLALANPSKKVYLIESIQKKAKFLESCVEKFGLTDRVKVFADRAEDLGQGELRESSGLILCRAVAMLPVLIEVGIPLLKVGGKLVSYKGPKSSEEIDQSSKALKTLNSEIETILDFELPENKDSRKLIMIRKNEKTPAEYPRQAGTPQKKPLV